LNPINNKLLFVILMALISFSSPVISVTQSSAQPASEDEFEKGVEFFILQDYANAVKSFKKAEAQGRESPALFYNLAGSYYKLGEYEKSREYFNKVGKYKSMQYLAEYNLGLIALKQADNKSAEKSFTSVAKNTKDKKLAALAEKKLKEVTSLNIAAQKKHQQLTKKWSAYLSASLGYDDNVNFAPLGIDTQRPDSFSEIVASADYLFAGNRTDGWSGEAYFYSINYQDEDLFDEYEYGAGIKKYLQLNPDWQTLYSLDMSKIYYAGEDYQSIAKISAESRNSLSKNKRFFLRYSYEDINSDNPLFDYLEGWRQKLRAEYRQYHRLDDSRFYYELELNDRNDLSVPTGDYSYSPTRHTFRGIYRSVLSRQWQLTGDLSYRASDYPATANQDRQDDRILAAMYADYRFTRDFKLKAKIEYTDNRSTEDVFAYKRTIYSLGLNVLF
jgi:hypothetical protein